MSRSQKHNGGASGASGGGKSGKNIVNRKKNSSNNIENTCAEDYSRDSNGSDNENNDSDDESGGSSYSSYNNSKGDFNHFNSNAKDDTYNVDIFGIALEFLQAPCVSKLGIGGVVWDSSVIFTKYIENLNSGSKEFGNTVLGGKSVLELGSGCGLSGLAFLIKGAKVTFTDVEVVVSDITEPNVTKNFRKIVSSGRVLNQLYEPKVFPLDWRCLEASCMYKEIVEERQLFDYIVLTDCIFSEEIVPYLLRTIDTFSHNNTIVYCMFEDRDETITTAFLTAIKTRFSIKFVNYQDMNPNFRSKTVKLFHAKKKRGGFKTAALSDSTSTSTASTTLSSCSTTTALSSL